MWVVAFSVKFDAIECTHDAIDDSRSQANRFASSRGDEATVHLFVGAVVAVEVESAIGGPLLMACRAGSLYLTKMLVDAGADIFATNRHGDTPLLWLHAG